PHLPLRHVRERAEPVPLHLERPRVAVVQVARRRGRREHRSPVRPSRPRLRGAVALRALLVVGSGGEWGARPTRLLGLTTRRHEVDEPVVLVAAVAAARVDEREAARAVLLAVERDDDLLAVAPLLELVRARVPDGDLAGAVLALRDRALERPVRERVVLRLDGEVVLLRVGRLAARERPAHEDAVVLQAEVPVQAPGVVLLDDEAVYLARGRGLVRHGLGRA